MLSKVGQQAELCRRRRFEKVEPKVSKPARCGFCCESLLSVWRPDQFLPQWLWRHVHAFPFEPWREDIASPAREKLNRRDNLVDTKSGIGAAESDFFV